MSQQRVAALIQDSRERAYMAALGILGDPDAALDAVQEATLRTLRNEARYDTSAPFYPWFYRILKNYCLDVLRKRKVSGEVRDGEAVIASVPSGQPAVDTPLLVAERDAAVHRAMGTLSEGHREILQLRHWQELAYDEIAAVLGVPTGTVMSRLYRARRALQDALDADARWTQ